MKKSVKYLNTQTDMYNDPIYQSVYITGNDGFYYTTNNGERLSTLTNYTTTGYTKSRWWVKRKGNNNIYDAISEKMADKMKNKQKKQLTSLDKNTEELTKFVEKRDEILATFNEKHKHLLIAK